MQLKRTVLLVMVACLFVLVGYAQVTQVGKASYYGKNAHGKLTSSGERFHIDSLTCAHRTYPFGTVLKVRDLNTDKEVFVKVTDRGPYARGRVIDLSYAAAKELDMLHRGISNVEIVMIDNKAQVPYRLGAQLVIPQLEVIDPDGDGYCLLSEWAERRHQQQVKMLAEKESIQPSPKNVLRESKADSVPRWKIFDKLSAMNEAVEPEKEYRYLIR